MINSVKRNIQRLAHGLKAKIKGSDRPVAGSISRQSMASSTHIVRWVGDRCEILRVKDGVLEAALELECRSQQWTAGNIQADGFVNVRVEKTFHINMLHVDPHSNDVDKKTEISVFPESARDDAAAEFDRIALGLIAEFFPLSQAVPNPGAELSQSLKTTKLKRSFFRRALRALSLFFGGALIVVLYSLIVTAKPLVSAKANTAGSQAQEQDASFDASGRAPAAWDALPQEQKDLMLGIATRAAQGIANEKNGLPAESVSSAVSTIPSEPVMAKDLDADQMSKIKSATLLKVGKGSKVFYVFEDPMCSACKHFVGQSSHLDSTYGQVVIPIGFQNGGRERAASALCSKDPLKGWDEAMQGVPAVDKPCEVGLKKIDANNALFLSLKMYSTPTMVGSNGALVMGSGETSSIAAWVDKNSK